MGVFEFIALAYVNKHFNTYVQYAELLHEKQEQRRKNSKTKSVSKNFGGRLSLAAGRDVQSCYPHSSCLLEELNDAFAKMGKTTTELTLRPKTREHSIFISS